MGYAIDLFLDKIDSELICEICKNVLIKPKSCTSCETLFCEACIEGVMADHTNCPSCEHSDVMFSKPHKVIQNMLDRLQMKCSNFDQGCQINPQMHLKDAHEKQECEYTLIYCSNEGCEEQIMRKDKIKHSLQCEHQRQPCKECQALLTHSEQESHNCIHALSIKLQEQSEKLQEQDHKIEQQFILINHLQQVIGQQLYTFSETKKSQTIMLSRNGKRATWLYQSPEYYQQQQQAFESEELQFQAISLTQHASYAPGIQVVQRQPLVRTPSWYSNGPLTQPVLENCSTILIDVPLETNKIYSVKFQIIKQRFFEFGIVKNLIKYEGAPFYDISEGYSFSNLDCTINHGKNQIGNYGSQAHEGSFVEMIINTRDQTLAYTIDGNECDVAFSNIPFKSQKFYPAVCRDPAKEDSDGILDLVWVSIQDFV